MSNLPTKDNSSKIKINMKPNMKPKTNKDMKPSMIRANSPTISLKVQESSMITIALRGLRPNRKLSSLMRSIYSTKS